MFLCLDTVAIPAGYSLSATHYSLGMASLSQKYRPKTFAEITDQKHVTETLRLEVATGKLGHAFLFSGPRGVGKTTTARVFAKALNCEKPNDGEPCNACGACLAANAGSELDLIELDAATHTQVEKIRESVIEHVRFAPMGGRRKVYVIDEAHMLSTSSWNALLKTLEEPPPYAFFILATTEWHKVPATIVSRCQRFEFKRIPDEALEERVRDLAKREGWKVDDDVVKTVVSKADGCVRDAETLLGQLGSLGESRITKAVAGLVIPESHLPAAAALMGLWADRNHAAALAEARRLFDEGLPLEPLVDDCITIIRHVLEASGNPALAETWAKGSEDQRAMAPLVSRFEPGELNDIALLLFERRRDMKSGVDPLFALQLAGTLVANALLRHSSPSSPPQHEEGKVRGGAVDVPKAQEKTKAPLPSNAQVEAAIPVKNFGELASSELSVEDSRTAGDQEHEPLDSRLHGNDKGAPAIDLNQVRMKWQATIRAVNEINLSLPFILKICQPEAVEGSCVIIRFQYPFHRAKILDPKHRRIVEECLNRVLETKGLTIDGVVGEDPVRAEGRAQDVVTNILKAFGGSVVES